MPAKPGDYADELWVYQPDAGNRTDANEAIRQLQEVINEVVSRHRGIPSAGANAFAFVPLDGVYGDEMKKALKQYLTTFTGVHAGAEYPYELRDVNLSRHLRRYLKDECSFDPDTDAHRGWIVDRHLLVGPSRDQNGNVQETGPAWDLALDRIDGLLELKEGVVDRLKQEMVRLANEYINCATFWLHRTFHQPYQAAADWVFRVTQDNVSVKTAATAAAPDLKDDAGQPVVVNAGDLFASPNTAGGWTQIGTGAGNGWVRSGAGRRVHNDQSNPLNHGTLGLNGVAYSFGCKDLLPTYTRLLDSNPYAPPQDGPGNQRRIAHWDEYGDGHRVGRRSAEAAWAQPGQALPANGIQNNTGCDCSGFTQNCITEAKFAAPFDNVRIVPNSITTQIAITAGRVPTNAIGAGGFVGAAAQARSVPQPGNDNERQWLRQTDIIASATHIVWVAEDRPNTTVNTFEVFNEYGDDRYNLANGVQAPVDNTRFLRKALRMPFHYWRQNLNGLSLGKIYIWH